MKKSEINEKELASLEAQMVVAGVLNFYCLPQKDGKDVYTLLEKPRKIDGGEDEETFYLAKAVQQSTGREVYICHYDQKSADDYGVYDWYETEEECIEDCLK